MENVSNEKITNWCVYMHENRKNGKKYIGITSQKPTHRWSNGHGYSRCPIFYAAIKKYGWDCFRHEILFTNLSQDEAEKIEIDLIAKYKTNDPKYGYNLASGGSVNAGFTRSEDFKRKLRGSKMGHPVSQEQRKNHSKKMKGRFAGAKNPCAKAVICVETGERFATLSEAAKEKNIDVSNLSACCHGRLKSVGGYRWKFAGRAVMCDA